MSVKVTRTLLQCIESSPQQHEVRQCLADLALQVCDLVRARSDAAEARQEVPSNSSEQPSTAPVSQPTAELEQLDDQLHVDSLQSDTAMAGEAGTSGQANLAAGTAAVPPGQSSSIWPSSNVPRPVPTVADITECITHAAGAAHLSLHT